MPPSSTLTIVRLRRSSAASSGIATDWGVQSELVGYIARQRRSQLSMVLRGHGYVVGSSGVVLLGEDTHGTSEHYSERARITKRLIAERGFGAVVIEGDPKSSGSFTMRLKLPADYKLPPHWHPADPAWMRVPAAARRRGGA